MLKMSKRVLFVLALFMLAAGMLSAESFHISPLLKSAAVPGWGQLSIDRSHGYAMLASEVLLWSTYYYNKTEQKLTDRKTYEYALKFAHINPGSYEEQYYRDLGKYDSSGFEAGGYNAMVREAAQALYPGDLAAQQEYIEANAMPEEMAWQWDSFTYRRSYSSMRKDILELKDQAQILTGVLIANHLFSTIDILRLKKHWKSVRPYVYYDNKTPVFSLSLEF